MKFKEGTGLDEKISLYEEAYPKAKVHDIRANRDRVYGATMASISRASSIALVLSIGLSFLISLLFTKMLVVKDRQTISLMKAQGFSQRTLSRVYMTGSMVLVLVSLVLGTVLVASLGRDLAGIFIKRVGVGDFSLTLNRTFAFVIAPLSLVSAVYLGTRLASFSIKEIKVADYIRG